jgi:lipopolysaccharide transport system ATP-binding protein
MSKVEIEKKFNAIVEFSEIQQFLDTPVKRYSSGMYVRLAFAVAAHLEPEILIVDEVLAVGDVAFQKKCLGKMKDVSSSDGRTILFVSHNMAAIKQLCTKCGLLDKGRLIEYSDDVDKVIDHYLQYQPQLQKSEWNNAGKEFENEYFRPLRFFIGDEHSNLLGMPIKNDLNAYVWIEFDLKIFDPAFIIGFNVYDENNVLLFTTEHTDLNESEWPELKIGKDLFCACLPIHLFNEGTYKLRLLASIHGRFWLIDPLENSPSIILEIQGNLSESPYWQTKREGIFAPLLKWKSV